MTFPAVSPGLGIAILCTSSRLVFAAVLLPWFLIGGASKLGGFDLSVGPTTEGLPLALGAYYTYAPGSVGALSAGLPVIEPLTQAYVGAMVLAELVLPVLIVLGLRAWPAVVLLALHQTILALVQPAGTAGALFDASPFDLFPDQLLLWFMLIAPVAFFGAGPLSMDAVLARWRRRRG